MLHNFGRKDSGNDISGREDVEDDVSSNWTSLKEN